MSYLPNGAVRMQPDLCIFGFLAGLFDRLLAISISSVTDGGILEWSVVDVLSFSFFFSSRRRHTRLVSDWSSDVCSSDLPVESYQAQSLLLDVNANQLRAAPSTYPDWVRRQFLVLPDSVPERVLALARDLDRKSVV